MGAARGLAYLHEDSQPRVIHRDFKGSNILLEDDYTPKVSDFGLAKSAAEGGKEHVSTRVMGTFGYFLLTSFRFHVYREAHALGCVNLAFEYNLLHQHV